VSALPRRQIPSRPKQANLNGLSQCSRAAEKYSCIFASRSEKAPHINEGAPTLKEITSTADADEIVRGLRRGNKLKIIHLLVRPYLNNNGSRSRRRTAVI
jgi:hypothetical protein